MTKVIMAISIFFLLLGMSSVIFFSPEKDVRLGVLLLLGIFNLMIGQKFSREQIEALKQKIQSFEKDEKDS